MNNDKLKKKSRQGAIISALGFVIILITFGFASYQLTDLHKKIEQKTEEYDSLNTQVKNRRVLKSELEKQYDSLENQFHGLEEQLTSRNIEIDKLEGNVTSLSGRVAQYRNQLQEQRNLVASLSQDIVDKTDSLKSLKVQEQQAQRKLKAKQDSVLFMERELTSLIEQKNKIEAEKDEIAREKESLDTFLEGAYGEQRTKIHAMASRKPDGKYYIFSIWLDLKPNSLDKISKVTYYYNHDSFRVPKIDVVNSEGGFRTEYRGWGCLQNMPITIHYKRGKEESIVFRMCDYLANSDQESPVKGGTPIKGSR